MVEWATAPTNAVPGSTITVSTPTDPIQREMCRNQMVRDTGRHISFSVLGLALIIPLGGVVILLSMVADTLVGWLQTGHKAEYRRRQWILEENLQLQRAAYEGYGI